MNRANAICPEAGHDRRLRTDPLPGRTAGDAARAARRDRRRRPGFRRDLAPGDPAPRLPHRRPEPGPLPGAAPARPALAPGGADGLRAVLAGPAGGQGVADARRGDRALETLAGL